MKMLVYKLLQSEDENGVVLSEVNMQWSEANEEIAKAEAYNGEYTIEEIEVPVPVAEPTELEIMEARLTYVEMMTGLLEE